jgi:hypothetical protein
MKHVHVRHTRLLIVLFLAVALLVAPVWAQGEVYLRSVEPSEGRPGQELELALRGGGFGGAIAVEVVVGELPVLDAWVESDQVIRARIFIPEDAAPGPRTVEVVVVRGQNEEFPAVLEEGFSVLEGEGPPPGPPEPSPEPPGPPPGPAPPDVWWLLILIVVVVVGVALGVTLKVRKSALQEKYQAEAREEELPETCRPGTHRVIREKPKLKPGRWKVTGLKVLLYDATSGQRGASHDGPSELVERIDKVARNRLLLGDSEKLAQEAGEIGRELATSILAWQSRSEAGRDVYLEPRIEGGEAAVKFTLYRCVGPPDWWRKAMEWTAKVQAVDHFQRSFHGPAAGESSEAYRASLEDHISSYVRDLIREAGRLAGLKGVEVSAEVSLG